MECPYIDANLSGCSEILNIQNLDEAFALCISHFQNCLLYKNLRNASAETNCTSAGPEQSGALAAITDL